MIAQINQPVKKDKPSKLGIALKVLDTGLDVASAAGGMKTPKPNKFGDYLKVQKESPNLGNFYKRF